MFDKNQFKDLVSVVLKESRLYSWAGVNLLLGTAAVESDFGRYIKQVKGPALGVFQMEPDTERDIWVNFVKFRPRLRDAIKRVSGVTELPTRNPPSLMCNLAYQVIMARIHYLRVPENLPAHDDVVGMAKYWKKHYNTLAGKGAIAKFVQRYVEYIEGLYVEYVGD